jgi:hypothetical protein
VALRFAARIVGLVAGAALGLGVAPLFRTGTPAMVATAQGSLSAEGTEFVLTSPAGRHVRSSGLVGSTVRMDIGSSVALVTIRRVQDDKRAINGRVVLHQLTFAGGKGENVCDPDPDGRSLAFPVPDGRGGYELTCTSGAVGKCVRWGYRAWEERPGGPPMRDLHKACVLMTRADYGGDGTTTTRDGTRISFFDRFGVVPCGKRPPLAFEAAWGRDRAVCVARPRIVENVSIAQLAERYPELVRRLGPTACTQTAALNDPSALVFNRS